LKSKTGVAVTHVMNDSVKSSGRKPVQVWCDKATKFYNKHVKKLVDLYSSGNSDKIVCS
jgi:hypothetical protein